MGNYRVSYKILQQQGEDIKAVAKLVDGYTERVAQISGKLGDDALLSDVRKNLSQLREQLVESRTVLNTAGEFLVNAVSSYSDVEIRQVKKVGGTKAHNRDFYKNPVVVATVGGAAGGGVAGAVVAHTSGAVVEAAPGSGGAGAIVPEPSAATYNYTQNNVDSSVNIMYMDTNPPGATIPAVQPLPTTQPGMDRTIGTQPVPAAQAGLPTSAGNSTPPDVAKVIGTAAKAAAGVAGAGAVAAGGIIGGREIKKRRDAQSTDNSIDDEAGCDGNSPEKELEKALARVRELSP